MRFSVLLVVGAAVASISARAGRLVIGRSGLGYPVDQVVGRGCNGEVARFGRYAIKLALRGDLAAPLHEGNLLAQLQSDAIPQFVEPGHLEGHPEQHALIMEYVPGEALSRAAIDGQPHLPDKIARLLTRLLRAVGEAHAKRYRHNDLKPSNAVGDPRYSGTTKVVDWGMATEIVAGDKGGGAWFNPPEQWTAEVWRRSGAQIPAEHQDLRHRTVAGRVDADTFAVGAIGLWMPAGTDLSDRAGTLGRAKASLSRTLPGRALFEVLERATELDPRKRYQSADALIEALRPIAEP